MSRSDLQNELAALRLWCSIAPLSDLRPAWAAARKKGRQDRATVIEDVASIRGLRLTVNGPND